jgi:hypothetical protein
MRKTIFVLLTAVSLPAFGEWKLTEITVDGDHLYYDPSTIERNRNFVQVWELTDLPALNQVGRLSYRTLHEYDCSAHRHRVIRSESYLTHMATGAPHDVDEKSSGDAEWDDYIIRGRGSIKWAKVVCAK